MTTWTIYLHRNKINGKVYIGQTRDVEHRWSKGGSRYRQCVKFYNAIKKYGWKNFSHEIIEDNILTQEKANEREIFYIRQYNAIVNGYNLAFGGYLGNITSNRPILQIDIRTKKPIKEFPSVIDAVKEIGDNRIKDRIRTCGWKRGNNLIKGYAWCLKSKYNPKTYMPCPNCVLDIHLTTYWRNEKRFAFANKFEEIMYGQKYYKMRNDFFSPKGLKNREVYNLVKKYLTYLN